jgi:dolichol-phosphate mannosyltransferase
MQYNNLQGIPNFIANEYLPKQAKYCLLIPIINEVGRIDKQLERAKVAGVDKLVDIIICDGNSTDGCTNENLLKPLGVNTLLTKIGVGKQGAQLRMGFWWALQRGYEGFITIDGNNKDSIEDVPMFVQKLDDGYDFIQGSRYVKDGKAINTPLKRHLAVKLIHAPVISLTAKKWFTDTTNAFRGYSKKYITHEAVQPFRDIFVSYELLAYLSVKASRLKLKTCEVPVTRAYPKGEKTPTKIKGISGEIRLLKILFANARGKYDV